MTTLTSFGAGARATSPRRCCVTLASFVVALLGMIPTVSATPITATASGCLDGSTPFPTSVAWTYATHFQAVVFHDPVSGCEPTIYQRSDWLLEFTVNFDANGGLRVTSNSANFPTCGRLQFDMHKYLDSGLLDPDGLVSLVVNLGDDCGGTGGGSKTGGGGGAGGGGGGGESPVIISTIPPIPPTETMTPVPEPTSFLLFGSGAALLYVRRRRAAMSHLRSRGRAN